MTERPKQGISPVEYLRMLRDNYFDDIPVQILHGPVSAVDRKTFKVRRNWWNGVVGGLETLQLEGLVSPDLEKEVQNFLAYYTSDEFHHQPLTTAEDIQRTNDLITKIIGGK